MKNPLYVTLDDILRGNVPAPTRTQRYTLALIVASSFLQLLDSPWFPSYVRKTDILFLRDVDNANIFLLDEPHVSHDVSSVDDSDKPLNANVADSLDALGIMLLELCFGRILEEHPCRTSWPAGGNLKEIAIYDLLAARQWQCQTSQEAGFDYAEAVGWCLGGNRSADPKRWRREMLRKVIQPLQRCCDCLMKAVPT
jgi:hypothetical protein